MDRGNRHFMRLLVFAIVCLSSAQERDVIHSCEKPNIGIDRLEAQSVCCSVRMLTFKHHNPAIQMANNDWFSIEIAEIFRIIQIIRNCWKCECWMMNVQERMNVIAWKSFQLSCAWSNGIFQFPSNILFICIDWFFKHFGLGSTMLNCPQNSIKILRIFEFHSTEYILSVDAY